MSKTVQIPYETFIGLLKYFSLEIHDQALYDALQGDLEAKLDALIKHETYSKSKTAESPQEREEARRKYLDMVGMRDSFRW